MDRLLNRDGVVEHITQSHPIVFKSDSDRDLRDLPDTPSTTVDNLLPF